MTKQETLNTIIFSTVKQEIIKLFKHKQCLYGDIFKELNLSQSNGTEAILS